MDNFNNSIVVPQIKYLTETLDEIAKGEIRVPKFQRPYVWKQIDVISLFDSILKGYPIGSLLLWETDQKIESLPKIGPYLVPSIDKKEINYIIDGHQRLSTLYGILKYDSSNPNTYENSWNLFFDLETEEFLFPTKTDFSRYLLPMNKIVSTIDFLYECQKIQNQFKSNSTALINKAQKLAQTILTYKVTITQIKGGDLSSAVEIFSRLNTKGHDMTPDQMFSALTYREGQQNFKLSDRIDQILERLIEYHFSEIERIFIFRAIIAASKRDIYHAKLEEFAKDKRVDIQSIVNNSEESIVRAVDFLVNNLNVPGDKLLPYNLQLVFLSEFFYNCPFPTNDQIGELEKWFWFTSYSGWFAGASSSKIRNGLDDIRDFAKARNNRLLNIDYSDYAAELPDKFDFRYARVKTFVLFLLSLNPMSLEQERANPKELLSELGPNALHYILPNININSNRLILGPVRIGYAKKILQDASIDIPDNVLLSHAITKEALGAFRKEDYHQFFTLRQSYLERAERDFMEKKGINAKMTAMKKNPFFEKNQLNIFDVPENM